MLQSAYRRTPWILLSVPFALIYLAHALTPETQGDAFAYHLGLVAEWLRLGGVADRIGLYETFPQGAELLYLPFYALGGAPLAKLVHLASLVATVVLMWRLAPRFGAPPWVALMFFVSPVVGRDATTAYNDVLLAMCAMLCFIAVLRERSLAAGLLAGACYSIKMTGGVFAVAGLAIFLAQRQWRKAVLFSAGAVLLSAPWMIRNAVWVGNPTAPLFNRTFPNPNFHVSVEEPWRHRLGSYDIARSELPLEVTVWGRRTAGAVGAVFLLTPLILLGLRRRQLWPVLTFAGAATVVWLLNAGARFLIPALPFFAIALGGVLPRPLTAAAIVAQAVLSLPWVMDWYMPRGAWRLEGAPVEAALRIESADAYLRRFLPEYRYALLVNQHAQVGERVLNLGGAPLLYSQAELIDPGHYAAADRAVAALVIPIRMAPMQFWVMRADLDRQARNYLKLTLEASADEPWTIQEITLYRQGRRVTPDESWTATASDHPWEAALAVDGNPITRWSGWVEARAGATFTLRMGDPVTVDAVEVLFHNPLPGLKVAIDGHALEPSWKPVRPLNFRREAARALARDGIRYVLAPVTGPEWGEVGSDLRANASDWNVELLGTEGALGLFRVNTAWPPVGRPRD